MSAAQHDVSRRAHALPRVDPVVVPRWLRQRRRERSRAAATEITGAVVARTYPRREPTLDEIIRAQGVKPFNWEEFRRQDSGLTSEDWAELRSALGIGKEQ